MVEISKITKTVLVSPVPLKGNDVNSLEEGVAVPGCGCIGVHSQEHGLQPLLLTGHALAATALVSGWMAVSVTEPMLPQFPSDQPLGQYVC